MAIEVLLIVLTVLFVLYVRAQCKGKNTSKIHWKKNKRNSAILARCVKLKRGYNPTFWATNPHIQTFVAFTSNFFTNGFQFRKEVLQMRDGGTISLQWFKQTREESSSKRNITETKPLLLISGWLIGPDPGDICQSATQLGYQPVVYKSRGQDIPLTSNRLAAYLDSADFCEAVDYIHAQHPFSDIFAVGYSLGCAPILGYLGVKGKSSLITSAVFISTTLDLNSMLNSGMKKPYHQMITEYFKQMIFKNTCIHRFLDVTLIKKGSSLREIFEYGHSVIHQCSSVTEYIKINNPISFVSQIRTPTLFLNALDDPVLEDMIPASLVLKNNNYCMEVLTDTGGHCGFATGFFGYSWATYVALEFHGAVSECRSLLFSPMKNGCQRLRSITR